eukprot:TRINITY_DN135_c0_g1_i1.p1 TRINITY_DN135_c0_g1~~TRINITY_DN135_c0_g1_i1.p1  ORF type:complete len:287 (-),score=46.79 TRINITY_DN135_c0_g1_i1:277-1137(-)
MGNLNSEMRTVTLILLAITCCSLANVWNSTTFSFDGYCDPRFCCCPLRQNPFNISVTTDGALIFRKRTFEFEPCHGTKFLTFKASVPDVNAREFTANVSINKGAQVPYHMVRTSTGFYMLHPSDPTCSLSAREWTRPPSPQTQYTGVFLPDGKCNQSECCCPIGEQVSVQDAQGEGFRFRGKAVGQDCDKSGEDMETVFKGTLMSGYEVITSQAGKTRKHRGFAARMGLGILIGNDANSHCSFYLLERPQQCLIVEMSLSMAFIDLIVSVTVPFVSYLSSTSSQTR